MISSQSEGLGQIALGTVKIYLESPFSANRRCSRSVVMDPPRILRLVRITNSLCVVECRGSVNFNRVFVEISTLATTIYNYGVTISPDDFKLKIVK